MGESELPDWLDGQVAICPCTGPMIAHFPCCLWSSALRLLVVLLPKSKEVLLSVYPKSSIFQANLGPVLPSLESLPRHEPLIMGTLILRPRGPAITLLPSSF